MLRQARLDAPGTLRHVMIRGIEGAKGRDWGSQGFGVYFLSILFLSRMILLIEVEPPRAKARGSSTCFEGGTLRSTPHYAPQELRRVPSSHSATV
jgi:hypothetical protein